MKKVVLLVGLLAISFTANSANWEKITENDIMSYFYDKDTFHGFDLNNNDRQVSAWVKIDYKKPIFISSLVEGLDGFKPFYSYTNRFLVQTRCLENTYKVATLQYYDKNENLVLDTDDYPELKPILTNAKIPMEKFVHYNPDLMMTKTAIFLCKLD